MKLLAGYRFDAFTDLCRAAARRKGSPLDLADMRRAHELTVALGQDEPSRTKVEELSAALGLELEDVERLREPPTGQAGAGASMQRKEVVR